ncbi:MAG: hypothetical protein CMI52_03785 [Parcubacteria group bacterium]|nr:hypothetical protein [Parcubacteria group bacterium]
MKVLQINKFWYRHGGADVYAIDSANYLKKLGHDVSYFGMDHPKNIKTKYKKYFVDQRNISQDDYEEKGKLTLKAKEALGIIYSKEAAKKLDQLCKDERPDIAHIHNIYHHLSPSILGVLKRHEIPVVQTLHDYKRLCPNHAMFTQGSICERCKSRKYYKAVQFKCIFGSRAASAVVATEMYAQSLFGWYDKYIDRFIAPSNFMKKKNAEWGRTGKNIDVLHYGLEVREKPKNPGENILYVGRLAREKGIDVVLKCAKVFKDITFDIAGDGPLRHDVEMLIQAQDLRNVKLHGHVSAAKVKKLRESSAFLLIPSQWYENYPISLLEQFAAGRGAIGSDLGGIPEIIKNKKNGFVCAHDDMDQWIDKIRKLWYDKPLIRAFGKAAQAQITDVNDEDSHYESLINIYKKAIKSRQS